MRIGCFTLDTIFGMTFNNIEETGLNSTTNITRTRRTLRYMNSRIRRGIVIHMVRRPVSPTLGISLPTNLLSTSSPSRWNVKGFAICDLRLPNQEPYIQARHIGEGRNRKLRSVKNFPTLGTFYTTSSSRSRRFSPAIFRRSSSEMFAYRTSIAGGAGVKNGILVPNRRRPPPKRRQTASIARCPR